MIVLLTGASGFFGQSITKTIFSSLKIITISRKSADITVDLGMDQPVIDQSVTLVVHAAGKAHSIPKTEQERKAFFNVNVKGTRNLLKGLEQSPKIPKYFVFISSVAVYGLETGHFITENTPLLATDPYGQSKIETESLVLDWCAKNHVICTILRLPLLIGPNPPGNLGAMIRSIQKGYYFNIAGGTAKKSMVLAKDVAEIIPKVASVGGIYNLTDGYHPNFFDLSLIVARQLGRPHPFNLPLVIAKIAARTGDLIGDRAPINSKKLTKIVSDLTFDDSKARIFLGWNPTPVLEGFKIK